MNLKDYTEFTRTTAVYPGANEHGFNEVLYLTLGLASEAGEVAGKIKKIVRGDKIQPEAYVDELSDVLWYLCRLADNIGLTLEDLADINTAKLKSRQEAGTIRGEGDNR